MTKQPDSNSLRLMREASRYLVGGVTAGARASKVFDTPFFAERAAGSRIIDVDGKEYIDIHTSFGAALLGHGHACITAAVNDSLARGILCAFETSLNAEVAHKLVNMVPCAEKVRFTATGTETTYNVIKLARGFTGRDMVIKFEGHFHGFNDSLQYNYWPPQGGGLPEVVSESTGAPSDAGRNVIVLPFNDTNALEQTLTEHCSEIAAVILEPINFNSGGILPHPGFLETLRLLTSKHGIVLIFDEILSGFRTGPGCMQAYLGLTPDLCTLGKALGGGLPLSAFAGRSDIMDCLTPLGSVSHSGTYLGHPTAMFACNAFLDEITPPEFWDRLLDRSARLCAGMRDIFDRRGVKCLLTETGARFSFLFGMETAPENYQAMVNTRDVDLTNRFFRSAMKHGLFTWTGYHHGISASHSDEDVDLILERIDDVAKEIA